MRLGAQRQKVVADRTSFEAGTYLPVVVVDSSSSHACTVVVVAAVVDTVALGTVVGCMGYLVPCLEVDNGLPSVGLELTAYGSLGNLLPFGS